MSDASEITFEYVVPKERYVRASLHEMRQAPLWKRLFLGCIALALINVLFMFILATVYDDWEGTYNEIEPTWMLIYGCFNMVVFFLAPFVLARMMIGIESRDITSRPPLQVTMTTDGYKIDFGGSHVFYGWPKVREVVETVDGFVFSGDGIATNSFEKAQLTDDIARRLRELLKSVNVPLVIQH